MSRIFGTPATSWSITPEKESLGLDQSFIDGFGDQVPLFRQVVDDRLRGCSYQLLVQGLGCVGESGFSQQVRAVVLDLVQSPGDLALYVPDIIGELGVGAAGAQLVITALVPMAAGAVGVVANDFLALYVDAEGRSAHLSFQSPDGP